VWIKLDVLVRRLAMNTYLEKVLWSVAGGIIVKYFEKFKKRIRFVNYSINISKIGLDQRHMALGELEIRFNGEAISPLYVCELTLSNTSGIDLENVVFTVDVPNDVFILSSIPNVLGGMIYIPFTSEYIQRITSPDPQSPTQEAKHFFFHEKEYQIPLLNRGKTFILTLLCQAQNTSPMISQTLKYKGVELRPAPLEPRVFGESPKRILVFGGVVVVGGWAAILQFCTNPAWASVLSMVLGLSFLLIGAVVSKLWTFVVSLFD